MQSFNHPFSLATFRSNEGDRVGLVLGKRLIEINRAIDLFRRRKGLKKGRAGQVLSVLDILEDWPTFFELLYGAASFFLGSPDEALDSYDIETISFLAPVPRPGKMVNVGLNSYDLAREMGIEISSEGFQPIFFLKGDRNCIIGPNQKIKLSSSFVSWEAELALVIGQRARNVSAQEAMDYVAGFTCHNDITDFGSLVKKDGSFDNFAGKSRETFAPLGPFLVPKEFVPNHKDLRIQCVLNGEVVQDIQADRMIWEPGKCIEYLSSCVTLQPGDVIALGTGAGVGATKGREGAFRNFKEMMDHIAQGGGRFLRSGDHVAVEISHVGQLVNEVE